MSKQAAAREPQPDLGTQGVAAAARPSYDGKDRHGRPTARTVITEPLDCYAHAGQLTDRQHEAGTILRRALETYYRRPRVTVWVGYASDAGQYDDDEHGEGSATDEEREERRMAAWGRIVMAERHVGPRWWATVLAVCEGKWATSAGGIPGLRQGLDALADGWGMKRV